TLVGGTATPAGGVVVALGAANGSVVSATCTTDGTGTCSGLLTPADRSGVISTLTAQVGAATAATAIVPFPRLSGASSAPGVVTVTVTSESASAGTGAVDVQVTQGTYTDGSPIPLAGVLPTVTLTGAVL